MGARRSNTAKLARRRVTPDDVEAVFRNGPRWFRNKTAASAEWVMIGHDDAGRRLLVGVLWADPDETDPSERLLRAITAWPHVRDTP